MSTWGEWIAEQGLFQQQVAELLGCSPEQVNEIVNGRAPVTGDVALRLERLMGIPVDSWLRYETAYRADVVRIADEKNLATYADEAGLNCDCCKRRGQGFGVSMKLLAGFESN